MHSRPCGFYSIPRIPQKVHLGEHVWSGKQGIMQSEALRSYKSISEMSLSSSSAREGCRVCPILKRRLPIYGNIYPSRHTGAPCRHMTLCIAAHKPIPACFQYVKQLIAMEIPTCTFCCHSVTSTCSHTNSHHNLP